MRSDMLFSELDGYSLFENQKQSMKKAIAGAPETMLSLSDDDVVAKYLADFDVDIPSLQRQEMTTSQQEIDMDVSQDPRRFFFERGRPFYIKGTEIVVHIPFIGEGVFFRVQPNMFSSSMPRGSVDGQELLITFIFANDQPPGDLKGMLEAQLNQIEQYLERLKSMASQVRNEMRPIARQSWEERKKHFTLRSEVVSGLGLPKKLDTKPSSPSTEATKKAAAISAPRSTGQRSAQDSEWDAFISHASEDKQEFVKILADALRAKGLRVWYDEYTLTVGDRLRRKIDEGLARSRFGIVVLSPSFFAKHWPQQELDGLAAREVNGIKVILPVWHNIRHPEVAGYSPMLADRIAVSSSKGISIVVDELLRAMDVR